MHNVFDPEEVYEKLEEILSLESPLADKRKWEDPAIQAYERHLRSLPQIISLEELKKYHELFNEKLIKSEEELREYEKDQEKPEDFIRKNQKTPHFNAEMNGGFS